MRGRSLSAAMVLASLFALLVLACAGERGGVELPVNRDTILWMYRGEPETNFGGSEPLFVEGAHFAALLGFDVSAAAGRKVGTASLWLHREGDDPLVEVVVSTISRDWIEGDGEGMGPQSDASCAAWVRIDPDTRRPVRWAGPGSDVTDVIMTYGHTLRSGEITVRQESGGWQSIEIPPRLVQALVSGEAYGLVIHDAKGQLHHPDGSFIRKRFNSRDSGSGAPYLRVTLEDPPGGEPRAVDSAEVVRAPELAGLATGAARLVLEPGEQPPGSYYEVRYSSSALDKDNTAQSGEAVERWRIPRIDGSSPDTVDLENLGLAPVFAAVRVVDGQGRPGPWSYARGVASPALAAPSLAHGDRPDLGGRIRVWACGADEKVNPVNGRRLEDAPELYALEGDGDYDYMYENHLWQARPAAVSIHVPRGGTAAFHLVVSPDEGGLEGIKVQAGWDNPPTGAGRFPVKIFRDWYLRSARDSAWYPEVAVPLGQGEAFAVPDMDNGIQGQRNQSVLVEYYVPRDARAGVYSGRVVVGARGLRSRVVRVRVNVHDVRIPGNLPFVSEMNAYGPFNGHYDLPNDSEEYFAIEQQYYRMAHEHLCVINQLPYTQAGKINGAGAPVLEGEGAGMRVADWSAWDAHYGRYLDGSAFRGTDREVPVPVLYLPFHENWPVSLEKYYRFEPGDTSYLGMVNQHALEAPPIEEAFDPAYEEAWTGILRQFCEHFREQGWESTEFQVYLNNKYYWKNRGRSFGGDGVSWWLLDEPYHWDDFRAIAYYGGLFMDAVGDPGDVDFRFRIDASRPHLSFGLWDGIRIVHYVSAMFYEKNEWLRRRKREFGELIRNYGAFNNLEESNLTATSWPLKVWLNGGDGLLPWQTIASDSDFETFRNTAVFYPGTRFGIRGPLASLRLKAMRRGTALAVMLGMLAESRGWRTEQTTVAAAGRIDLGGATVSEFFDDAGRIAFGELDPAQLAALEREIMLTLEAADDE